MLARALRRGRRVLPAGVRRHRAARRRDADARLRELVDRHRAAGKRDRRAGARGRRSTARPGRSPCGRSRRARSSSPPARSWLARPRAIEPAPQLGHAQGARRRLPLRDRACRGSGRGSRRRRVILMVAMAPYTVLLPRIVQSHYHRGVGSYGLLFSAMAAGMVAGSLAWARWHPRKRPRRDLLRRVRDQRPRHRRARAVAVVRARGRARRPGAGSGSAIGIAVVDDADQRARARAPALARPQLRLLRLVRADARRLRAGGRRRDGGRADDDPRGRRRARVQCSGSCRCSGARSGSSLDATPSAILARREDDRDRRRVAFARPREPRRDALPAEARATAASPSGPTCDEVLGDSGVCRRCSTIDGADRPRRRLPAAGVLRGATRTKRSRPARRRCWLQLGIVSAEARAIAEAGGARLRRERVHRRGARTRLERSKGGP